MPSPTIARPGRNEPCFCGSGRKYKQCCLEADDAAAAAARAVAVEATTGPAEPAPEMTPKRTPKHQTQQPWRNTTSRGFVARSRTPRKVGGA